MSLLETLGAGAASGVGAGVASSALGFLGAAQQQKYLERNQKRAFAMQQTEEKLRARNNIEGLKMAGLSPSLASDGKFSPGSAPTSPLGSMSYPSIDFANSALAMAQAKKAEAEAENINVHTAQETSADDVAKYFADVYFDKLVSSAHSPEEKKVYEEMKNIAINKGSFGLFEKYIDILDKKELYDTDYHEYMFRRNKAYLETNDPNLFNTIVRMPEKNRELLESTIKKYGAEVEKLRSDTSLTDEERNLKLQQIELTKEEIENLRETTKNLKNTNIMKMLDDGEYGKAFVATILLLFGQISATKRL